MDWELLPLLIGLIVLGLIICSPAVVLSLTFGVVVSRLIRDPGASAFVSGLVGLLSFWTLLGITLVMLVPQYGWGGFIIAWAGMLIGLLALPVTVLISLVVWRLKRRRLLVPAKLRA